MPDKYHALRSAALIIALFWGILAGVTKSDELSLTNQILQAIEDCMNRTPSQWPDEWKREYIETIRKAIELHRDASNYAERLEILRKGFVPYWESFEKISERSFFELHYARIRWYTEHLMGTKFPNEEERQKLRDQYKDIWNYAAKSLLAQFPFLDPNAVQAAKAEDLRQCYQKIDAPLMPVYLRPLSAEQVGQIKQRWDKLRYARVDPLFEEISLKVKYGGVSPELKKKTMYEIFRAAQGLLPETAFLRRPPYPGFCADTEADTDLRR